MELLQLKYFQAVAQCENMTLAAKTLRIAQPAISQSISRLERELGYPLFTRNGKRIRLNACGTLLLQRLPSILGAIDNVKIELSELSNNPKQHICLNVLSCSNFLPKLLQSFRQKYPATSFNLIQNPQAAEYDICLSSIPSAEAGKQDMVLMEEEMLLAVPRSYTAAGDSISMGDLTGADFISLNKGSAFRAVTDYYCQKAGFTPHIVFESDNPSIVRGLIGMGLGVAFWPRITWGPVHDDFVKTLHIKDLDCRRSVLISVPKGKQIAGTVQLFLAFAKEFFSELAGTGL